MNLILVERYLKIISCTPGLYEFEVKSDVPLKIGYASIVLKLNFGSSLNDHGP